MSVFKYHAFIYFLRPPPWYGTIHIYIYVHIYIYINWVVLRKKCWVKFSLFSFIPSYMQGQQYIENIAYMILLSLQKLGRGELRTHLHSTYSSDGGRGFIYIFFSCKDWPFALPGDRKAGVSSERRAVRPAGVHPGQGPGYWQRVQHAAGRCNFQEQCRKCEPLISF